VDGTEYAAYVARAQRAETIRELRDLVARVCAAHPGDAAAERVADVCQLYAVDLMARLGRRRARAGRNVPRDYTERAYR
jgi:hypothetical protein